MGQITIDKRNGDKINLFRTEPFCTVTQAVQNFTLMGDDSVQLTIKSADIIDFAIGDKILVGGDEYSIRTKSNREIISEDKYVYEVTFYGVMYELMKTLYRNTDINGKSSKSTFDLTYSLADFIKVLIYNVSRDYPGMWRFDSDSCPETEPITIQFSKMNCLQVLQNVCKSFGYEFRIDLESGVRVVRIGEFGAKIVPPNGSDYFEQGKGSGLYKLKEQKVDDKSVITRLWVEGGTKNLRSDYRDYSDRLQLPIRRLNNNEHTLSDGTVIPARSEYIGIADDSMRYFEDEDLKNKLGSIEDIEQIDEISPIRTGEVTALGSDVYSFVDSTMDFDLNEKDGDGNTRWLINGNTAKITFITGLLAGQEFELKESGGYNHSTKTFNIIKYTDERGLSMPTEDTEAFRIHIGDKYKITDINLPDRYIDNSEEDLWYAGYDMFMERKQMRAQYVLTFDRSYFLNTLPDDSETSVFRVGDYVPVKDERFGIEKFIRIQKLSRNLLVDHDYTLTISDITSVSIQSQIVQDVIDHNIIIDTNRLRDVSKARRAWRTTEELRNMVFDTDGYFDGENIRPNSIDTNMLTVGSKSQQFILVDIILEANVNGLANRFDATAGNLVHLTIDEDNARVWNMAAISVSLSESGGYYVYAKCNKAGSNGLFHVTQEQIKVDNINDPNNYYFQVGIIGSLNEGDTFRDFVSTYGFTRINGNTITTGRIVTSDGTCYLDLDGNKFRIGDTNSSLSWLDGQLLLKGAIVQSGSGDFSFVGAFRGVYQSNVLYYPGDDVTYESDGVISSYRHNYISPISNIPPTNGAYWAITSQGSVGKPGEDGSYFEYRYAKNGSTQKAPPLVNNSINPSGWSTSVPNALGLEYIWCTIAKKASSGLLLQNWSDPVRITPSDGTKGDDGISVDIIEVQYAKNDSNITAPTTGWSSNPPSWENGKYIWSRTKIGYTNNIITTTNAVCISGGKGVKDIIEEYYQSSSSDIITGGSWVTDVPKWKDGWYIWIRTIITYTDNSSFTTDPVCITGSTGSKGDSPVMVFRGIYEDSNIYYGNSFRLDAVKYNGIYYIARVDAGTFTGKLPTNTNYWNTFGAQFDTVATNLLLAENANVAGFIFRNNRLESEATHPNGDPLLKLDGINGIVYGSKGVWSGSIWHNYTTVNDGDTLDPLNPNIMLCQSYIKREEIIYLPDITAEIIGSTFNIYWNGLGTRSAQGVQQIKSKSANIIDFNSIGSYGTPDFKSKISCDFFSYGFVQLMCVNDSWIITNILGSKFTIS